jgi:hypothetical protein
VGAAVGAAVAVVALVAVVAAVASAANKGQRRPFDGWISLRPEHPLRLIYANGVRRIVPLDLLRPSDLVGLKHAYVRRRADGPVIRLQPQAAGAR